MVYRRKNVCSFVIICFVGAIFVRQIVYNRFKLLIFFDFQELELAHWHQIELLHKIQSTGHSPEHMELAFFRFLLYARLRRRNPVSQHLGVLTSSNTIVDTSHVRVSLAYFIHFILNDLFHGHSLAHLSQLLLEYNDLLVDFIRIRLKVSLLSTPLPAILKIFQRLQAEHVFDFLFFLAAFIVIHILTIALLLVFHDLFAH